MVGYPILYTPTLVGELNQSNNNALGVTTKSDRRSGIDQPVHWWVSRGDVVCSYRFARRDWKHSDFSTNLPRTMGTDILDLLSCRDCRLLPKLRCLFRGLNSCLANRTGRRWRFPCLRCGWAVFPLCNCGWLCHARALGSVPLPVRLFTCGPVDNGNSTGLRSLLLSVRLYGRVLSHDKKTPHGIAGQARSLLLATSPVIPQSWSGLAVQPTQARRQLQ